MIYLLCHWYVIWCVVEYQGDCKSVVAKRTIGHWNGVDWEQALNPGLHKYAHDSQHPLQTCYRDSHYDEYYHLLSF